jgi:AbrB family looped-hinge helix DNA binding protein
MPTEKSIVYSVSTIGTKGQIVIPVEAREEMGLNPGEKVIIFSKRHHAGGPGLVCLCPIKSAEKLLSVLTEQVSLTQRAINSAKDK